MIRMKVKYVFSETDNVWKKISKLICNAPKIFLFLDYDGTIAPIQETPSSAIATPETLQILCKLAQQPQVSLNIVTGRSMEDIQSLIPIDGISYIANHGFHIIQDEKEWIHPSAQKVSSSLRELEKILSNILKPFKKCKIENKHYTLSVHYRLVPIKDQAKLIKLTKATANQYDSSLVLTRGKKVIEIRPNAEWGKGNAVLKILGKRSNSGLVICFGDDNTDEDVFEKLRHKGLTIRVGKSNNTLAKYYVKNTHEVIKILKHILIAKNSQLAQRGNIKCEL